jgi:D-alanine-D-alanine ligase
MVSVASAQNLVAQYKFDELWFFNESGQIFHVTKDELTGHHNPFKVSLKPTSAAFAGSIQEALPRLQGQRVFMGFHGTEGEDGKLQELFEKNKIAFTGSGSKASRLCFEKNLAKQVVAKQGLPTAPELMWDQKDNSNLETILTPFFTQHSKIVLKPVANGSSIGLHIVSSVQELRAAIVQIQKSPERYMAEKFVTGRELTVGAWERNNGEVIALTPSEVILNSTGSFDYDGKYLGVGTTEVTPARLTDSEKQEAQRVALAAHKALGCQGYSRTDMILTSQGIFFLETNTLPGLTKASFVPQQLQDMGIAMTKFIESQLQVALQR